MQRIAIAPSTINTKKTAGLVRLFRILWPVKTPSRKLDVNGLSDHLKRDMGFLDGGDTKGRRR
jgi:hypothetical protein